MRAPGRAIRAALNRRVQFALFRSAFAILLALVGSTAEAGPQAVPRKYQAGFYLDGCKDFLAGRSNFVSGRCVDRCYPEDSADAAARWLGAQSRAGRRYGPGREPAAVRTGINCVEDPVDDHRGNIER
jgi:hypothetical protein